METRIRVISIGIVVVAVAAASLGFLGVRTRVTTQTTNGYTITIAHAAVTRPGLATPFSLVVETADGSPLPAMTTVRVSAPYLAIFDDNGMEPQPVESYNTPEWTWWTFEVPTGEDRLQVVLDARLEPAVQWGERAEAAVEIDGREVVAADFSTWVMP